ncbi:MAG: hypothetical protein ABI623_12760 [bacterium]
MVSEELHKLVEESSAVYAAHVIDIAIRGSHHRSIIEIFIDSESVVTSDLCSGISRKIAEQIDLQELIKGSYELVVSSPGIDRPLKFPWQYKKHLGRKLELKVEKDGISESHSGKLSHVNDEGVTLQIGKSGEEITCSFTSIQQGIVKSPW